MNKSKKIIIITIFIINIINNIISYNINNKPLFFFPSSSSSSSSSLFGFSILTVKHKHLPPKILIGAPLSESKLTFNTETPGTIYECEIGKEICNEIVFYMPKADHPELYTRQMFGSNIVHLENDLIMICAPKKLYQRFGNLLPRGECFTTDLKSFPFKLKMENFNVKFYSESKHVFSYGLIGFSSDKLIDKLVGLGAPGANTFSGTFFINKNNWTEFKEEEEQMSEDSYFGYAIKLFYILNKILVALGGPSYASKGAVKIVEVGTMKFLTYLFNDEFGSYFGSSLERIDVDNDGHDELVVGAPFLNTSGGDEGAVYIYKHEGTNFKIIKTLFGEKIPFSRFGFSILNIGDLNQDGFQDLAISAPGNNINGKVFVYFGGFHGFQESERQILESKSTSGGFGYSLGSFEDSKGYPNLLVGSVFENKIYNFPSFSAHSMVVSMTFSSQNIKWEMTHCSKKFNNSAKINLHIVLHYKIPQKENSLVSYSNMIKEIKYLITVDKKHKRGKVFHLEKAEVGEEKMETKVFFSQKEKIHKENFLIEFPFEKQPSHIKDPVKVELEILAPPTQESQVVFNDGKALYYYKEINFGTDCNKKNCKPEIKFYFLKNDYPFIIGGKSTVEILIGISNKKHWAFNVHFSLIFPSWLQYRRAFTQRGCHTIKCLPNRHFRAFETKLLCEISEPISTTIININILFNYDSLEDNQEIILEPEEQYFNPFSKNTTYKAELQPYINSTISAYSSARELKPFFSNPLPEKYHVTHLYDIRNTGKGSHPHFDIVIFEPLSTFNQTCCVDINITAIHKTISQVSKILPIFSFPPKNKSSISFDYINNSITCKKINCHVYKLKLEKLFLNESIDVSIETIISGDLLREFQKRSTFVYKTEMVIFPYHISTFLSTYYSNPVNNSYQYQVLTRAWRPLKPEVFSWWLVLLCLIIGFILLFIIMITLYKCGFFKRHKHDVLINEGEVEEEGQGEELEGREREEGGEGEGQAEDTKTIEEEVGALGDSQEEIEIN